MFPHPITPTALSLPWRTPRAAPRPVLARPGEIAPRFTLDGDSELERHLAHTCEKIAAGVCGLVPPAKLEALLLGGGYGRGEGGVLSTGHGDRPYNDLEFYVCLRGHRHLNERRFGRALHTLGEILTPQAGVEVEFKIASLAGLERSPVTMFAYDLVLGHRRLVGDENLFARCAHHREATDIPLSEATRLLMNRGTGLLFTLERLRRETFTATDADFTARNIAKAELALGDAVLVASRQYHWSVRERHRLLERVARCTSLPWLDDVRHHHARGVEFKLHPQRSTEARETLAARHAPVTALAERVWLWLESKRLEADFASVRDYAASRRNAWPGSPAWRNVLVNLKTLGLRPLLNARAGRHPRERVLRALPLLLWETDALATPALLCRVQHELQTRARDFPTLVAAYRALWTQVN